MGQVGCCSDSGKKEYIVSDLQRNLIRKEQLQRMEQSKLLMLQPTPGGAFANMDGQFLSQKTSEDK